MSFTISFGWWLAPLALTILCFFVAWRMLPKDMKEYGGRAPWGNAVVELLLYGIATIVSALIWIVYLALMVATK